MRHPTRLWMTLLAVMSFLCVSAGAEPLENDTAAAFLQALADHPDSMDQYISPADLAIAHRLGITYREAPCKPLISWDLSATERERLQQEGLDGQFIVEDLGSGYSRLVLFPGDSNASRQWVFQDDKVVSSILYRVRNWKQVESAHFRFFISDTTRFHPENIATLESFLMETAALLEIPDAEMDRLGREKILYCFCSSQDEILDLTGFNARGMYMVSHDIIVSTFSAHYHELAHLLINYKLQNPHLYTHPFFLEGFAVAVGGRGGKAPDILHQLGLSIHRAGWLSLDDLLDAQMFYRQNASISYPGSAPYNRFLLEALGAGNYLALYDKHGGDANAVMQMRISPADLPPMGAWKKFLNEQPRNGAIRPGAPGLEQVAGPVAFHPLPDGKHFGFAVPGTTLTVCGQPAMGYRSFLYEDFFENERYAGERYFIRASAGEVAVYDLFTNTMLALYASGFSEDLAEVPSAGGRYLFRLDPSVLADTPQDALRKRSTFR